MDNLSTFYPQGANLFFDVEKYPLVEISKKFAAPVERVWRAFTSPALIKQWWGPLNYTCPTARMEVHKGGSSMLAMKGPDGKVHYSGGIYEEVVENKRLVTTDLFMDGNGNPVSASSLGLPGDWPDIMRILIEFKSWGPSESGIHLRHQGIPKEAHDDCLMGWTQSLGKLKKMIEHS